MLNMRVIYIYYCISIKYVLKNLLLLYKNNKQNRRNETKKRTPLTPPTGVKGSCNVATLTGWYQLVLKGGFSPGSPNRD